MIILHKLERDTCFRKFPFLIAFQKKAPLVLEHFGLNQQNTGKGSWNKVQNNFLVENFAYKVHPMESLKQVCKEKSQGLCSFAADTSINTIERKFIKRAYYSRI